MSKKFKERNKRICEMYLSGQTLKQVGKVFGGLNRERIRQILHECDIPRRSSADLVKERSPQLNDSEVVRRYSDGESMIKIVSRFNTSYPRIKRILVENNVELRPIQDYYTPAITRDELYQLYVVEKKSQAEIGKIFHITQTAVSRYVIRYGLQKRKS